MPAYLSQLANFAANLSYQNLPPSARNAAADILMDTIGAIIGGSRLPENSNLANLAARNGEGPATLLGHNLKAQPPMAALANATAGVALEMDEGSRLGGGHPAIHILPGALAVAENLGSSGPQLAEALIAGYEISSRIGGATRALPNVHSHGTWGTIGTAVAVAKLMDFDADRMRDVINLAASMSPANTWTPCFEGATIRNVYPGRSGMQGVLAPQLLLCGFTPPSDAPTDLYTTILGDQFDSQAAVAGLGQDPLRIEQNYFKFHACCLYNHPVLDAVQAIATRENINHDAIQTVNVTTVPFAQRMAQDYPPNMLSAKFHVPYAVAALLVSGRSDITVFYQNSVDDPAIRDLADRVAIISDPTMNLQNPDKPCARVDVTLTDGRTLTESTTYHHGDFQHRRPRQELQNKFRFLTSDTLDPDQTEAIIHTTTNLHNIKNIRTLTPLLQPPLTSSPSMGED